MNANDEVFESWAIVELMGHRKIGGYARSPGGPGILANTLRVDIHETADGADKTTTQYYGAPSVYCITPTSEELARKVAEGFSRPLGYYSPIAGVLDERGEVEDIH